MWEFYCNDSQDCAYVSGLPFFIDCVGQGEKYMHSQYATKEEAESAIDKLRKNAPNGYYYLLYKEGEEPSDNTENRYEEMAASFGF